MQRLLFPVLCLISILLLLSGCAEQHLQPSSMNITPQTNASALNHWTSAGVFSLQQTNQQPVIASFRWQQQDLANYRIDISSSLNIKHFVIIGQPGQVMLVKSKNQVQQAATAEQLLQQVNGWTLPVTNLQYWIRGQAAPSPITQIQQDPMGRISALQQDGWYIQFSGYQLKNSLNLPTILQLQQNNTRIKIVVKQWLP